MARKKTKKLTLGPILTIVILNILVIVLSFVFSKIGFVTNKTEIINNELSTTNVVVNNLVSRDGIKFLFSSILDNFKNFNVLYVFIIALLGMGLADDSGLFRALFKKCKKFKLSFIIVITLIIGCLMGFLGEYSYAIFLPLTGYIYKNMNKSPLVGVITMFIALSMGQATGILPTYLDEALGKTTELAAKIMVDQSYKFSSSSMIYIVISSLVAFIIIGVFIIQKYLIPKLPKLKAEEEIEELEMTNNGLKYSLIAIFVMLFLVLYAVIPGLPLSGSLLGEGNSYLEKLLADGTPFKESYVFIFTFILSIAGLIYGFKSKKFKNLDDFTRGFSRSFAGMSIVFVLMFFLSQLIALVKWSNLDVFLSSVFINWLSSLKITGMGLIVFYFIIIIMVSVLIPDSLSKWQFIAPIAVPLFMRANMTASFAQYIFSAADGIGKSISIFFPYTAILFGLIYKYTDTGSFGFFRLYKMLSPVTILFTIFWIVIIITWYVVGIPMGIGVLPSL